MPSVAKKAAVTSMVSARDTLVASVATTTKVPILKLKLKVLELPLLLLVLPLEPQPVSPLPTTILQEVKSLTLKRSQQTHGEENHLRSSHQTTTRVLNHAVLNKLNLRTRRHQIIKNQLQVPAQRRQASGHCLLRSHLDPVWISSSGRCLDLAQLCFSSHCTSVSARGAAQLTSIRELEEFLNELQLEPSGPLYLALQTWELTAHRLWLCLLKKVLVETWCKLLQFMDRLPLSSSPPIQQVPWD